MGTTSIGSSMRSSTGCAIVPVFPSIVHMHALCIGGPVLRYLLQSGAGYNPPPPLAMDFQADFNVQ